MQVMPTITINQKEISDKQTELKVPAYFKHKYGSYHIITKYYRTSHYKFGTLMSKNDGSEISNKMLTDIVNNSELCQLEEIIAVYDQANLSIKNEIEKLSPFNNNNRVKVLNCVIDEKYDLINTDLINGLYLDIEVDEFWDWCEANEWNVSDEPGYSINKIKDLYIRSVYNKMDRFYKDWEAFKEDKETFIDALECFLGSKFN